MGDRASYAIRRPGVRKVDVRYAHFGSPFLFADAFWGPASAQALIESLEPGAWLDDVFGEAALAMCLKTRRVGIYTHQLGPEDVPVARRLMQPLWPGWEIRFGARLSDVTPTVGVDLVKRWVRQARRGAARQQRDALARDPLARLGEHFATSWLEASFDGMVTCLTGAGAVDDRLADVALRELLFVGPALVDALPRLPSLDAVDRVLRVRRRAWDYRSPADLFVGFQRGPHATIDVPARRLVLSVEPGLQQAEQYAQAHAVEVAWPGWHVAVQTGGLEAHFGATGRAVPDVLRAPPAPALEMSERERVVDTLRHIRALVLDADRLKEEGAAWLAGARSEISSVVEAHAGDGAVLEVDPGLGQGTPPIVLSPDEKRRLWAHAVREAGLVAEDEAAAHPAPPAASLSPDELFYDAYLTHKYNGDPEAALRKAYEVLAAAPDHAKGLGLVGRLCLLTGRLEDARRYSEAALAREPEDAEAWATLALVANRAGDFDEVVRCYGRAVAAAPYPWMVDKLTCAYLDRAEREPDPAARRALLERALEANALSPERTSSIEWGEACARSMLEDDAETAYAAVARALRAHHDDRAAFGAKLLADPQLAWVFAQKQGKLPAV